MNISWSDFNGNYVMIDSNKEQFTENSIDISNITQNIGEIKLLEHTTTYNIQRILDNSYDISNNISNYNSIKQQLSKNNSKYHYDDVLNPGVILKKENEDNLNVVLKDDLNKLNLYQNSVYITSAIACATLVIALIIIIPSRK
jgi:hypothetical protein